VGGIWRLQGVVKIGAPIVERFLDVQRGGNERESDEFDV
jgi:hypothetical protein